MKPLAGDYDNSATVDDEAEILASFQQRSQAVYQQVNHIRNIPYGKLPRQTFDWLFSGTPGTGTIIFIHGGYWQCCNKEDFAFIAEVPLALGYDLLLVEYTLAPQATLTAICQEIGMALAAIELQLDLRRRRGPVFLAGHSAGGQLAAYWQQHPLVDHVFPISGIFELEPLLTTYVNQRLQLTDQEIAALSPLRNLPAAAKPMTLFYGAAERPELIAQSEHYHAALCRRQAPVTRVALAGANHYTVLDALFGTDGALIHALTAEGNNR
ncbi:alpha/beta hydrolase [Serratia sp. AKBS12]|uniref:alpha/beta hydrolase n=1 Tax=Serratia sp. AKBS12 TaxID=2974597 RepID=UPI00216550C4|nr:alpha/beta hydrolase [Serratia sp. AKBS12]MCS3408050.1 alpha/beta hydrolase [Serratia sp. AKBS12]